MKRGSAVFYVDGAGRSCPATVSAVVGTGGSGYKVLDLLLADGRDKTGVPYQADATGAYWAFEAPAPKPEPEPVSEAEPEYKPFRRKGK